MILMPNDDLNARLWDAFAAECAAYMKYTFFAQATRQEGFQQIGDIFEETAENEKAHARLWFQALGQLRDGKQPGDTLNNLLSAAEGERLEWTEQYRECAQSARSAGDSALALRFEGVGAVEASHEKRFRALMDRLNAGETFICPQNPQAVWRCRFCGHLHTGPEAPASCPVCGYPQAYFELNAG